MRWARSVPFPPVSLQRQVVCLSVRPVFISGESLHCFLVGWCTNKSYVIATSDLWLFIHASNLLPSTHHPTPYIEIIRRVHQGCTRYCSGGEGYSRDTKGSAMMDRSTARVHGVHQWWRGVQEVHTVQQWWRGVQQGYTGYSNDGEGYSRGTVSFLVAFI